jgi:hypothetical protein
MEEIERCNQCSRKRREIGEEKWAEHQRQRKNNKADAYKSRNALKVVEWRRRTKLKLIAYKGGKCENCPYDKPCASCYDFHHRDPKKKDFQIGGKTISFERLKAEADKCMLLCRNCHAELHDNEYAMQRQQTIEKWLAKGGMLKGAHETV